MIDMFPDTAVETEDVSLHIHLFVQAPPDKRTDKVFLAKQAIEWLRQLVDEEDDEYEAPETFADRVQTPLEVVRDYYESMKVDVPSQIRDAVRKFVAELPEADRVDIHMVSFTVTNYSNGWFYESEPGLILRGQTYADTLEWEDVFENHPGDPSLDEFTGDLTEAYGPLTSLSTLVIDLDTLACDTMP